MSEHFDPYYKWLGIPPQDQPPTHYRLLGINLFESDPQVIEAAADRQMAYLRTFKNGQQVQQAQKLLNEIAQARVCLLNAGKKAAYDHALQSPGIGVPLAGAIPVAVATPVAQPAAPMMAPQTHQPDLQPFAFVADASPGKTAARGKSPLRSKPAWQQPAVIGVAGIALVSIAALVFWSAKRDDPVASRPSTPPPVLPPPAATNSPPRTIEPPAAEVVPTKPEAPPREPPPRVIIGSNRPEGTNDSPSVPNVGTPSTIPTVPSPAPNTPSEPEIPSLPAPPPMPQVATKKPLPSAEEFSRVEQQVRGIFGEMFEKALKPDAQLALARILARKAEESAGNPLEHSTLLRIALILSAESGDPDATLDVLARLAQSYDITDTPVALDALTSLNQKARSSEARMRIVGAAQAQIDAAVANDQFESAEKLSRLAADITSKLRGSSDAEKADVIELRKAVKEQWDDAKRLQRQWHTANAAAERLKTMPDDPAALLVWGKYLCLVKKDWDRGLPLLAKSDDAAFKSAAQKELSTAKSASDKQTLAKEWADLAKISAADREQLLSRAQHWYEDALDEVEGLEKTKIEQSLAALRPAPPEPTKRATTTNPRKKKQDKDPLPGMAGRVIMDNGDAGLTVIYQPGRQLEDSKLREALEQHNIKWRPLQLELEGVFQVPATDYYYFHQTSQNADTTLRMFVDNTEVNVVRGADAFGNTQGLRLLGGRPHLIRWIIAGRDSIGTNEMRIYFSNNLTGITEPLEIYYSTEGFKKLKTKAEVELTP